MSLLGWVFGEPPDNSAMMAQLAQAQMQNNLMGLRAQIDGQVQVANINAEAARFQGLMWLTAQQEKMDTSLQIAMKDADIRLRELDYDYDLRKREIANEARELDIREIEASSVSTDDLGLFA